MTAPSIGQFEQVVLASILALGDGAYGVSIHARVEELARPRKTAIGAVYTTLDRLESKGLVSSRMADPTPERGGRAKRYYRLEASGAAALREAAVVARRVCEAIDAVAGWTQAT
jgi:DNA-binding PadR family transcriptional regulator